MNVLEGPLVFVDIETNGLNPVGGKIIEIGAIRVEGGQEVGRINSLIDPGSELPPFISDLTGIASDDLRGAPSFYQIADELMELLTGATFVAHNVRFDYSFIKTEFKRLGKSFSPRQLCTVRLSRALYPTERSHKLGSLIQRHGLNVPNQHRAFDDAHALWQFLKIVEKDIEPSRLASAVARQVKSPSLPKNLEPEMVKALPETTGVYVMEDDEGKPLYIGKSVNIKKRVLSHFSSDHGSVSEFKLSQTVQNISIHQTSGELRALLLESELIKKLQPLHNKRLRRISKLILVRSTADASDYINVSLEEADSISPDEAEDILAVYGRRGAARDALDNAVKDYQLCLKLMGLEKSKGSCFAYQLHKCAGACIGKEPAEAYNSRVLAAFDLQRIHSWPFDSPVVVSERVMDDQPTTAYVVDKWCIIGEITEEPHCEPTFKSAEKTFDLDTYKILRSFFSQKIHKLIIKPISPEMISERFAMM